MSEFNITVEGGKSVRLPTAGKYCDRDIIISAEGGEIGNYQISIGTAIADGVAIYVEDLPFTPKYVAIFICESDDGPRAGLIACAEFGTFDGVDYSSQTEPFGGSGGMGSNTEPSEIELTENGFIILPRAGQAAAYRYIAIG